MSEGFVTIDGMVWLDPDVAQRLDYVGALQSVFDLAPRLYPGCWDVAKTHAFLSALVRRSYAQEYGSADAADRVLLWCSVPDNPTKKLNRLLSECSDAAIVAAYQKIWSWFQGLEQEQNQIAQPAGQISHRERDLCPQF